MNYNVFLEAKTILIKLINALNQISTVDYVKPIMLLSNATIGQHTRHIIEFFEELNQNYEAGIVDYDLRKRNILLQTNIDFAIEYITLIIFNLEKDDKMLIIKSLYQNDIEINSSYYRELLFNIEHCVHHQAIIRIGMLCLGIEVIDEYFGVAKSTSNYRKSNIKK